MPQGVPIQAIPNQELTITLDGNLFDISIKTTNGATAVSISVNGGDVMDNIRAVAGSPIIPARYLEQGNFMFMTMNSQLPIYTQFNISQSLYYYTAAEIALMRTPPPSRITPAYFNPIADLPLRFAPQGYSSP